MRISHRLIAAVMLCVLPTIAMAQPVPAPFRPAPVAQVYRSEVIPRLHLKRQGAVTNPIVCMIGDSTSTDGAQNPIAPSEYDWQLIKRREMEDNPGKTFSFLNFGIGGQTWANAATVPVSFPSFYFSSSVPWMGYLRAANCDTIFYQFGTNDSWAAAVSTIGLVIGQTASWATTPTWTASAAVGLSKYIVDGNGRLQIASVAGTSSGTTPTWATTLNGLTTDGSVTWRLLSTATYVQRVPDAIIITNENANPSQASGAPFNTLVWQVGTINAAAVARTVARTNGASFGIAGMPNIGLIDVGRYLQMAIDGYDPVDQYLQLVPSAVVTGIAGAAINGYNLPTTQGGDFDLIVTFPGAAPLFGTGALSNIRISIGSTVAGQSNQVSFNLSGGAFLVGISEDTLIPTVTGGVVGTGDLTFQVTAKQEQIFIYANGTKVFDGAMPRYISSFAPQAKAVGTLAGVTMNVVQYSQGIPKRYTPTTTYDAIYGVGNNATLGGNGKNHQASVGISATNFPVFEATSFCSACAP